MEWKDPLTTYGIFLDLDRTRPVPESIVDLIYGPTHIGHAQDTVGNVQSMLLLFTSVCILIRLSGTQGSCLSVFLYLCLNNDEHFQILVTLNSHQDSELSTSLGTLP